jgi:hypothetical protein
MDSARTVYSADAKAVMNISRPRSVGPGDAVGGDSIQVVMEDLEDFTKRLQLFGFNDVYFERNNHGRI